MSAFLIQTPDLSEDYQTRLRKVLGHDAMTSKMQPIIKTSPLYTEDGFIRIGNSKVKPEDILLRKSIQHEVDAFIEEHKNNEYLKGYNLPISNKILFFGPSGCGKTLLASVLANALEKPLFIINLSRIVSSGLGQTSSNISEALESASSVGAILFFDEFDALAKERGSGNDHGEIKRITSSLLQMIDHLDDRVILIAATNHIDFIDKAIVRRFGKKIEFFEPNVGELKSYLQVLAEKAGLEIEDSIKLRLSNKWKGLSFASCKDKFIDALKKFLLANRSKKVKVIGKDFLKYT